MQVLMVLAGGALGALLRWKVSALVYNQVGTGFPWGTIVVNLSGALLIGLLWGLSERFLVAPAVRTFFFIGILGAYTTFSTLALETLNLLRDGEVGYALANVLLQNMAGVVLVIAGLVMSRLVLGVAR